MTTDAVIAPGPVYHSGFVVGDIRRSIGHWVEQAGAGPFVLFEHFRFVDAIYRGAATALEVTLAFAYSGDTLIELIQPVRDLPSIYDEATGALHHVGIGVPDLQPAVQRYVAAGIACAFEARFPFGGGCAYLDTIERIGVLTELVQLDDAALLTLERIRLAHQHWNRRDHTFTLS